MLTNNNSELYLIIDSSNDIDIVISATGNDKCITRIYLLEQYHYHRGSSILMFFIKKDSLMIASMKYYIFAES